MTIEPEECQEGYDDFQDLLLYERKKERDATILELMQWRNQAVFHTWTAEQKWNYEDQHLIKLRRGLI